MIEAERQAVCGRHEPVRCLAIGGWRTELLPRSSYEVRYVPDGPLIGFAFEAQRGVHSFASDKQRAFAARANGLAFVPAGCEVYSRSDCGGEYLRVVRQGSEDCELVVAQRFSDQIDNTAIAAAYELRRRLLAPDEIDVLSLEVLALTLVERANALLGGARERPRSLDWMTPYRLRRVDEIIGARFADKLTISDIAFELGLSPGFFTRAFKAATGRSPQDYVMDWRVSRARALLSATDESLSVIACACGFASHAHMTAQFRKRLNATPSRIRGELSAVP